MAQRISPRKIEYSKKFYSEIKQLIDAQRIESLIDVEIPEDLHASLLYSTDDYFLSEKQFSSLVKLLQEGDSLYVMQLGDSDDLSELNHELYEFPFFCSYEDYRALDFYSISILFSSQYNWVLVIDESLEGGIGLFVGEKDAVDLFESFYGRTAKDLCELVLFFLRDSDRNKNSLLYMERLLRKVNEKIC